MIGVSLKLLTNSMDDKPFDVQEKGPTKKWESQLFFKISSYKEENAPS